MTLHETLLQSKEIRRLIVERSERFNVPLKYVCLKANISYERFIKSYINTAYGLHSDLTEKELIKVLEILGVSVRYNIVIDPRRDEELKDLSRRITEEYESKK